MHRRGGAPVDAGVERSGRMGEADLPAREAGARSGRRACARRGRGRSGPARGGRGRAGSGRGGSRSRPLGQRRFGSKRRRPRTISRGSAPAIHTLRPRSSSSRPSSRSSVAGSSSRRSDRRACGSRLSAMSWLPSTANAGRGSTRTSRRSIGSPRGWVRRSPLIATRSGFRSRAHSAACQTAPTPGDGTPRWKSERCAIRSPSSSGGSPGSSSSSSRSRTQPASSRPQPRPAAAAQPRRLRLRAARAPAAGRRCGA